jgi:hypothetical protein
MTNPIWISLSSRRAASSPGYIACIHGISALPPNPSSIMAVAIVVIMTIDIIASRGVQRYQELQNPKRRIRHKCSNE